MGVSHYGLDNYNLKYVKAKKKNYGNSNILPCKNYNIQKTKSYKKETKIPSRYYYNSITNLSSFNTSQNIGFQKKISSYENRATS
jgi:hypothetical protein